MLCEVAWVLATIGRQGEIKPTLEKILSYRNLKVIGFDERDILMGASNMVAHNTDFNDGLNIAIMLRAGISEVHSNDYKHLGKPDFLRLVSE